MECNKDEATRARELAEKKFTAKDINGAKKFALKAQNLYPGLEGIPQMIATLDVYISAENKINGEADWYGILGVDPLADDEAVRKQYRKLALMLHPDKNKSIGAEGAFKLISEAWSLLSDKTRRVTYDKRRGGKVAQTVPAPCGNSKASKAANGFYNAAKTSTSSVKTSKSSNHHGGRSSTPSGRSSNTAGQSSNPASFHKVKPNTFWTICHRCKMHYEYLRVYLNHNLLCPNCHEPFLAVETAPPTTSTPTPWTSSQQRKNSNSQTGNKSSSNMGRNHSSSYNAAAGFTTHDSYNQNNFQWGPFSRTGGTSTAAQAASVVQQAYEKVRREREEAQAATKREEAMRKKHHGSKRASGASSGYTNASKRRRGMEDGSAGIHGTNITNQMGVGNSGPANLSGSKLGNFETGINGTNKYNSARDMSQVETQSMLIYKAKREIQMKLNEWNSSPADKTTAKDVRGYENANEKQNESLVNNDACNQKKGEGFVNEINRDHFLKPFPGSSGVGLDAETVEAMSIIVPDPDFHDFEKDRTERSFEDNQVWALYDDDDGMPRYYAMIHSVLSQDPFKIRISWLISTANIGLSCLDWEGSGFSKTCGEFVIGSKTEIYRSLNSFSHKVRWTKGKRGAIFIYPRKGDVWAIYRNWSSEWITTNDVIHKYDMVEVLDDYNGELGVTVIPLVKVAGFKTVFHRHLNHKEIRRIPKEAIFCFSHQVPSYLLTGQEAANAPKGCRELDPGATPEELLQVIMDVKDEEILENGKTINEENVVDVEKPNDEVMVNCEKAKKEEDSGSKIAEEIEVLANVGNT